MNSIIVICPHCGAKLAVPQQHLKANVRCGRCKEKFPVEIKAANPVEDVVASWLTDDDDDGDSAGNAPANGDAGTDAGISGEDMLSGTSHEESSAPVAVGEKADARIIKVDGQGTLMEFAPNLLLRSEFRSAFPRQCVRCEARVHLQAHVVIFAPQLRDSMSVEDEHNAGTLALSNAEVQGLSDQQILDRLPEVPNVPAPANLPMPYWLCDMCSGAGQVSGQILVNRETGSGFCKLLIRNPRRALGLIDSAFGKRVEGFDPVTERGETMAETPWDNLAEVV